MKCPRRMEGSVFVLPEEDTWDPDDDTCSYCGSFNPDTLMARLEVGDVELGPTDKGYKVYLENKGGSPFKMRYRKDCDCEFSNKLSPQEIREKVKACPHWTTEDRSYSKFYFMHFSEAQMKRFIELLNEKKLKIGMPGHFYRMPYFIKKG